MNDSADSLSFLVDASFARTRQLCLDALDALGWHVREDISQLDRIALYVPIPDLLPNAPVYFISLYPLESGEVVHIVLTAADDDLSRTHARVDLPALKDAILSSAPPADMAYMNAGLHGGACFISYRRYDSADATGRIYDRLVAVLGRERVFKDVDDIPLGADFRKVLDDAVGRCAVLLVVIGRDWLTVTNEHGQRRLDDPADFVRLEVESALRRGIPVIPVLVRDAAIPRPDELPESICELVYHNGIQVRPDPDFHHDVDRLIRALNDVLG